jgi:hypothetical protein
VAKHLRAGLVGAVVQRAKIVRTRGLAVTCQADRAARCRLTVEVSARDARRYGVRARRNIVVGTATGSPAAGRDARLSVRLNATGRRLLARARSLTLIVRGTVQDGQGERAALVRAVVVRR